MEKLQPIGSIKKKTRKKPGEEQISFRLIGDQAALKKQFVSLLEERGLETKEVLVQFIKYFVETNGNVALLKLDSDDISTSTLRELQEYLDAKSKKNPKEIHRKKVLPIRAGYQKSTMETLVDECNNLLQLILEYGHEELADAITQNLVQFAKLIRPSAEPHDDTRKLDPDPEWITPEVRAALQRARAAIDRSRRARRGSSESPPVGCEKKHRFA